jgi:hypothetical protein
VLAYIAGRPPRTWADADTDRFEAQSKTLGRLFQTEVEMVSTDRHLTAEQREQSEKIAGNLKKYIQETPNQDPLVIKAALQILLKGVNK